ncbi:hypothetical protein FAM22020_001033 [Propionibacterium freudenreichii]|jgi:hypothetical protein|uniref:hypothetical protein n=1 Tax=Propionibacterium freudenreichii TaxID=1744 RepID=UPI000541D8DD|nr:hypothetical protein [Propionibacterium freudenreichii]AJQ90006.1 Hypothetical protein RM25_0274 [Propionibacterium freudenreichii subsp. freudenreichii]MCT3015261.1 hypothetical protein [Propionibacterium freudenreichii]MDK9300351.1 hypothetical protein [Propionibacterium freudenreichii]MDK9302134.1 hypothetical protein [Propionibacterium freudenreichii]MDK9322053.1 hypothetical protein [Propionibacterium freudenreichii]
MSTNPSVPPTPPQQGVPPQYAAPQPPKKTGLSTAGLVLGIIAVVFAFIPVIGMPVAIIGGALALLFGILGIVKKHGGKAIAATILGVAAIIVAIVATTTIYGAAKSVSSSLASASASLGDFTGENTEQLLQNSVNVTMGTFSVASDGFTTQVPVTVKNITDKQHSYSITIAANAADGSQVATDSLYANDLAAGQSTQQKAFQFVSSDKQEAMKTATLKVTSVSLVG